MVSPMNRETFDKLIENYDSHDEILISKIALLIEMYPYFQLPRFFYTKSFIDQNKNDPDLAINQLALYTADRGVLKESIESKFDSPKKIEKSTVDFEAPIEDSETTKIKSSTESTTEEKSIAPKKEHTNVEIKVEETPKKDIPLAVQSTSKKPTKKTLAKKSESHPNKLASISKDLKLSFLDWIQFTEEKQITDPKDSEKEGPLIDKLNIIDRFIEADPKIPPVGKTEAINSNIKQDFNSEELMTETLAKVLVKQKKYKKAISAYKILSLKYPEKNVFFAGQIQKIKKLQQQ
tara:strand:- start:7329 stop:8204 length:876 start_codon:yes stop_codon:yes gene_type:complete